MNQVTGDQQALFWQLADELQREDVIVVSQISSVEKSRLGERVGSVSAERVDQVVAGLRFLQRSYFER